MARHGSGPTQPFRHCLQPASKLGCHWHRYSQVSCSPWWKLVVLLIINSYVHNNPHNPNFLYINVFFAVFVILCILCTYKSTYHTRWYKFPFFPTKSYKRIETLNGGLRWLLALVEKVSKFRPYNMYSIFICLKLALYGILEAIQKPTRVYIFFLTDIWIKTLKFKCIVCWCITKSIANTSVAYSIQLTFWMQHPCIAHSYKIITFKTLTLAYGI